MRNVAFVPAAASVLGAVVGLQLGPAWLAARWLLPIVVIAAAASWLFGRPRLTVAFVTFGFVLASAISAVDARDRALHPSIRTVLAEEFGDFVIESMPPARADTPLLTRAVIVEDASIAPDAVLLRLQLLAVSLRGTWRPVDGGVSVSVFGEPALDRVRGWRAGRTIVAPLMYRRPAVYFDDGVPDFERDLALGGTTLFASVKSGLLVDVEQKGSAIDEVSADVRAFVRGAVNRWVGARDAVAAGIVAAVLIGDRTGLPDAVRDQLQAAGTYHVIAISGGNIAILAAVVVVALAVLSIRGRTAAIATIVVLLAYAEIVSGGPSVSRAAVMAVCYLAARALDHRTPPWHAVAFAAAALVIVRPVDVRDAGFLLTFGATIALLQCADTTAFAHNPAARWLVTSMAASLATELALMPVSARIFSRVTIAGIVLNLIAVPVMAIVQVAGMLLVLLDRVAVLANAAGWAAYAGATLLVRSARVVEWVPWLAIRLPPPPLWIVVTYYGALSSAIVLRARPVRRIAALTAAIAGIAILTGAAADADRPPNGILRWTMFDIGQGDAMALQWRGRSLIVDTGGAPFGNGVDIGSRVLAPALWARGIRAVQALLVTHGDPDHIGGAASVVDIFSPQHLWLGIPVPSHIPSQELIARAFGRHVVPEWRRKGEVLEMGDVRVRVLNPPSPDWERQRVRNDDSVVLEIVYRDVAILLTGDISAAVERAILPHLTLARTRILKVAHHGSRTSTSAELLERWRPQIAVISCGRGNTFGHPAPDVLERLESIGARIYRTDRDGEVTIDTDGSRVSVRTFIPRGSR